MGSSARAVWHPSPRSSSRRRLGTEPRPAKAPGASRSCQNRHRFISAPGTGTHGTSARGQDGAWPAQCGDGRRLVIKRPCCCRERRAGVRPQACGRGSGAVTKHWRRAPDLQRLWKCASACLHSGALQRRRDDDRCAPVRDAQELALDGWTRVAAGTHWPRRIHLTSECHSCSAATWPGVAAGHVRLRNTGRNLASLLQKLVVQKAST